VIEYHSVKAFAREEPRIELIEATLRSLLSLVELEYEGEPVKVDGFRLRNLEAWRTAPATSLQLNLGSLSTRCNCRCAFCYEEGNPPGLFETEPPFVGLQEARTRARYLRDGRGLPLESKSTFESLSNPDYLDLARLMRAHDPEQLIDLTTNGAQLTEALIAELAGLKPVLVNLSLNSADPALRASLMADRRPERGIRAPELLRAHGIPFLGSIVPWPEQGVDDLARTIEYLDAQEARTIRIAMPALSGSHPRFRRGQFREWLPEVLSCVEQVRCSVQTPVIVSPFTYVTSTLDAIVEGVVRRSPAATAGVRLGDRILAVDGRDVVSRAHASSLLGRAAPRGHVELKLQRGDANLTVALEAPPAEADLYPYQPRGYGRLELAGTLFGLCLPGAFHLGYVRSVHEAIVERGARRPLVLASAHFHELVAELLAQLPLPSDVKLEVLVPRSRFFGGDVDIGDLWVLDDVAAAVAEHAQAGDKPDLLILPSSFLSRWGRDLLGTPYTELESRLGLQVVVIPTERIL
jgi:hypothetical protein